MIKTFKKLSDDRTAAATFMLAIALLVAVSFGDEQNWPFIGFYAATALYALWIKAWLGFAAAVAVTVVRTMVEYGVTGFPFQLASVIFAALFLLLVVGYPNAPARHGRVIPRKD